MIAERVRITADMRLRAFSPSPKMLPSVATSHTFWKRTAKRIDQENSKGCGTNG